MESQSIMFHIICGECDSTQGKKYTKEELKKFLKETPLDEQHCSQGFCRAILYDARCQEYEDEECIISK